MTVEEQRVLEALLILKDLCATNYSQNGSCDCPCYIEGKCKLIDKLPVHWDIVKRMVFFGD